MNTAKAKIIAALSAIALSAAACSSAPERPDQQLARAETGIEFAEENGAVEYGLTALDRARNNLRLAQQKAQDGEYEEALRLAQKAEVDAELAAAQSSTGKAREALEQIKDSIATLRREIAQVDTSRGGQS